MPGSVLFLQKRMGRHGQTFTILKFRTMLDATDKKRHAVTTNDNQQFTSVGPFLRRWKLDKLPQLLNVLWGNMRLVSPRPKMPEDAIFNLHRISQVAQVAVDQAPPIPLMGMGGRGGEFCLCEQAGVQPPFLMVRYLSEIICNLLRHDLQFFWNFASGSKAINIPP